MTGPHFLTPRFGCLQDPQTGQLITAKCGKPQGGLRLLSVINKGVWCSLDFRRFWGSAGNLVPLRLRVREWRVEVP
jgi:hypothetical protein